MPQSTLSARRVLELVPGAADRPTIEAALFASKAELADWTGDDLRVEVTADRLDLLSEGGLGLYLAGALGRARGIPPIVGDARAPVAVRVDPSVRPVRPVFAGVVLDAPSDGPALDDGLLAEAVRFQELLHATVGRDRRLASLGIYPLARVTPPIVYALEPLARVRFVPLDGDGEVGAATFFSDHPLAAMYGSYGRDGERCLTLRDAAGTVLSLPPVLNSRTAGEARVGDRRLLLESTGTLAGRVEDAVGLMMLPFVARGWRASTVAVDGPPGSWVDSATIVAGRQIAVTEATLRAVGGDPVGAADVEQWAGRARLVAHPAPHGWRVTVPPWRPDVLAEVDVVEDLLLARGLRAEDGVLPPTLTRGRRRPEARFRDRLAPVLLGLGLVPLCTTVLVAGPTLRRLERSSAIAVANPVSELYSHLRDTLQVGLVSALEHNVRFGYPQRLSEIGPVLVRDPAAESGAATRYHAGVLLAGEGVGLADVAALVDYVLGTLGTMGVREPAELPATIAGRAARLRLAGEPIAEMGELHPRVLTDCGVPVPAAWAEIDLDRLWPLVARRA